MKKLLVSILLFIPFIVFAETTSYEKLDIKFNFEIGTQVDKLTYSIYANTNESEILKDRTSEFTSNISLYKVNEDNSRELLPSSYILRNDETYSFTLSDIKPNNNATLNINDISKVLINTSEQTRDNLKISISENVLSVEYTMPKVKKIDENKFEAIPDEPEVVEKKNTCFLGLSICCKEYKNISYCILGGIGLIALIVIITIINFVADKQDDKKYKDF